MSDIHYERVDHKQSIPATITTLQEDDIKKFTSYDIFIPPHWHRSLEISLIENAQVALQIGTKEQIIEDDFTCINSGVVHSLRLTSLKQHPQCIILLISYDFIRQYYPAIDKISFDLSLVSTHEPLKALYRQLCTLYHQSDPYMYMDITACILQIVAHLIRNYSKPAKTTEANQKKQKQMKEIITYLHEHYMEEITLSVIANTFHLNKDSFSRNFHHYVGTTFRDYLVSYRLYKAYDDVIGSSLTIQCIALKHGFYNVRSFIKTFFDVYHKTPMRYRKSQQFDIK